MQFLGYHFYHQVQRMPENFQIFVILYIPFSFKDLTEIELRKWNFSRIFLVSQQAFTYTKVINRNVRKKFEIFQSKQ